MGFRLANVNGRAVLVHGDSYTDIATHSSGALGSDPMEVLARPDLLSELSATLDEASVTGLLADVVLGPPVPRPQKSFGIGLNYASHVAESGRRGARQSARVHQVPVVPRRPDRRCRDPQRTDATTRANSSS